MDHKDVLNELLSHSCPTNEEAEIKRFDIELHCIMVTIYAKSLGWNEQKKFGEYEILKVVYHNG